MSLVVTSNIGQEDNPEFSNAFKPYSYQNRLLNTMKIPPNSEIALQSVKINKNGLFVLDRTNSDFCHYFGTPLAEGETIENSTSQPFRAVIGAGAAFRSGSLKNEVNIEDMANEIERGLSQAAFHPSLITSATTSSVQVSPIYEAATNTFQGFKFVATQQTAKTTRLAADITFTGISKNNDYDNFTQNAGRVTSSQTAGFYVQNREYPLSQNEGECVINFSEGNDAQWMIGLSRINDQREKPDGSYDYLPRYFDDTIGGALIGGIAPGGRVKYADICIVRSLLGGVQTLRVFQSGRRSTAGTGSGIFMNEVTYYGQHNTNFDTAYDIGTNADKYQKVKFVLDNEEIKIYLINDKAAEVLLCDHTTLAAAGAVKNECLNPINAAKWALYPVIQMSGAANVGKYMTVESIDHYTNYPLYDSTKYFNYDWWGWSQQYNQTIFCKALEERSWNNFGLATLLAPKNVNASGGMDDYESTIITGRSVAYGNSTDLCNTQFILGFVGEPVSSPISQTNLVTTIQSSTTPKLVSNISLFVRLNNFTQNSVNARQGTTSKIVGHLPRFDNSGNETGGLYFEPHEKTYLALNNTDTLYINSFDVDLVYENETLCTALTGKTIVCFHVRPMK